MSPIAAGNLPYSSIRHTLDAFCVLAAGTCQHRCMLCAFPCAMSFNTLRRYESLCSFTAFDRIISPFYCIFRKCGRSWRRCRRARLIEWRTRTKCCDEQCTSDRGLISKFLQPSAQDLYFLGPTCACANPEAWVQKQQYSLRRGKCENSLRRGKLCNELPFCTWEAYSTKRTRAAT